jgi:hypothetical protein
VGIIWNLRVMRGFLRLLSVLIICLPGVNYCVQADIVKPALIEISVYKSGRIQVEMRASIEALLTGINSRYKNTQDSPAAEKYDDLRAMPAQQLEKQFKLFVHHFLSSIELTVDTRKVLLELSEVHIPEPGYTKVPRMSTVYLQAKAPLLARNISWYYPAAFGDNAVRVRQVDAANKKWHWSQWQWLKTDSVSTPFSLSEVYAQQKPSETLVSYVPMGFKHILPRGLDHILFVLGLFLFSRYIKPLVWQITMFTLAHTLTLGLATAQFVSLPDQLVEPLIALSIAYIGFENLRARKLANYRLALVFLFGLIHGLGFAGVLLDFGMPSNSFLLALISFNIGVEIGQLTVIAIAFIGLGMWFRKEPSRFQQYISNPLSFLIGVTGLIWTIERIVQ